MEEKTWTNLKHILFSERSQLEKAAHYMTPSTRCDGKGKTIGTVKEEWLHKELG